MSRLRYATRGGLLVGLTAALFGAGCVGTTADGYGPPPSTPAYVPPATAYDETPAGSEDAEADLEFESGPPVNDIDEYPSVFYEGAPVFFIGGTWYRHDRRGWGVYHREPPGLAHERAQREHDPRWVQAGQRRALPESRAASPMRPQPLPVNRPNEVPRQGVTEWQGAPTHPQAPSPATGPRPSVGGTPPTNVPVAPPAGGRTNVRPGPAPHPGAAPAHGAPSPAPPSQHR
jgi:hypothetical protein